MSAPAERAAPAWSVGRTRLAAAALLVAAFAAYANTFRVPFLLDDEPAIAQNLSLRHLWPLGPVLSPPPHTGPSGRPLLNLSYALNYALSGPAVGSYHAANLLLHAGNALLLFGLLRRVLVRRFAPGSASFLAFATALLWTVHPLQTEAVTYLSERAETLMATFYLLTLYAFLRGAEAARPAGRRGWLMVSGLACFGGMATKEVMVTAPVIVFLLDAVFVAGGPAQAGRARPLYYASLAASWLFLAGLMASSRHAVGYQQGVGLVEYALTECQAVVHYVQLALWPNPLVFDYGPLLVSGAGKILPEIVLLFGLLGGTAILFWRSPALGFLGLWFFVLLAPTSSVVPVALQPIAENRMYLPLAALVLAFVLAADRLAGAGARWLVLAVALAALAGTVRRNADYRDALTLWTDTVAKRPHNPRAQDNFGNVLAHFGRFAEAEQHLRLALQLTPNVGRIHYNLAKVLHDTGRRDEALREYRAAVRLDPGYADAQVNLATTLAEAGQTAEAQELLNRALRLNAGDAGSRYNLGMVLVRAGRLPEAAAQFQQALQTDPTAAEPREALATTLFRLGRPEEALAQYRQVLSAHPEFAAAHHNLGNVLSALGRTDEARAQFEQALALQPDYSQALTSLGVIELQGGEAEHARAHFEAALQRDPNDAEAHFRLGNLAAMAGRLPQAMAEWETTLRLRPDDAEAHNNLATALAQSGKITEAIQHYQEALRLQPNYERARANLADLQARQAAGAP